MIRIRHFAGLTAAAFLAAAPAAAAPGVALASNSATSPAAIADQAPRASRADSGKDREICVRTEFTGSRMIRRICKTAAEWERAGGLPDSRD